jgi:uncharacterized protein
VLDAVARWGSGQEDIVAIALVGSYARGTAGPESDVDLVILAEDPESYLRHPEWVGRFGRPLAVEREDWGRVQSLRVRYREGPEVEFGLAWPDWAATGPVDEGTKRVVSEGLRILVDRQGKLAALARSVGLGLDERR